MKCSHQRQIAGPVHNLHLPRRPRNFLKRHYVRSMSTNTLALRSVLTTRHYPFASIRSSLSSTQYFSTSNSKCAEIVVRVPRMAESISEGTLSSFSRQVGDIVEADEEIASIETDKIDVSVNASETGVITEIFVHEGDTVKVGQQVAKIDTSAGGSSEPNSSANKEQEPATETKPKSEPAPLTDAALPRPSQKEEAKSKIQKASEATTASSKTPTPAKSAPDKQNQASEASAPTSQRAVVGKFNRGETRVKMNRMRMRIAERLKQSQNAAAFLTTFNEVDMSGIMELRKRYKDDILKTHGIRFGFMSAFAKAATLALQTIPAVNASIEGPDGGNTIVFRDYVDISIAVSTPRGLVTPVVRNCESLSMLEIEKEIARLAAVARDGKMTIEDMAGGSFTISNGGVFGSMMGTPIINLPQTAVLGIHSINDRAVVVDGKIEIRPMMYLALTYDHRLLDGSESVKFLVAIRDFMQDPGKMLLA